MLNKIKNRNQGFTIVETLIVLAIAGLIILIVLLAVPALQRTSRNTNIKNDASTISGGINEFESNNSGSTPDLCAQAANAGTSYSIGSAAGGANCHGGTAGGTITSVKIQSSDQIVVNAALASGQTVSGSTALGVITIVPQAGCDGSYSPRSFAVYYPIDIGGGSSTAMTSNDCLQS